MPDPDHPASAEDDGRDPAGEAGPEEVAADASAIGPEDGTIPLESEDLACPSCGALLKGDDTVVCLRCGFDLQVLEKRETATGADEIEIEEPTLLVPEGRGGVVVPLIIAGAAGLILLVGYLAGLPGLYPAAVRALAEGGVVHPPAGDRFLAVLRFLVHTAMWTTGGLIGVGAVAWIDGYRLGSVTLAASRLLAVAATMRLVTLIGLGGGPLEWTAEALGQAVIALVGLVALVGLGPKVAATVAAVAGAGFLMVYAGARVIVWIT